MGCAVSVQAEAGGGQGQRSVQALDGVSKQTECPSDSRVSKQRHISHENQRRVTFGEPSVLTIQSAPASTATATSSGGGRPGQIAPVTRQTSVGAHEADLERASRTVWVGGVPPYHADQAKLMQTFDTCGVPQVCKVRVKDPSDPLSGEVSVGCWALVTFKRVSGVQAALAGSWSVTDENGENEATLSIKSLSVEAILKGPLSSYLAVKQWGIAMGHRWGHCITDSSCLAYQSAVTFTKSLGEHHIAAGKHLSGRVVRPLAWVAALPVAT